MADEDVAFKESLLNTLAGTLSVNQQERLYSEDQLKIFETSEGGLLPRIYRKVFESCLLGLGPICRTNKVFQSWQIF